ncbi:MAG: polysaccharide deacetylase family protein [Acidimicrobiales bacterium]
MIASFTPLSRRAWPGLAGLGKPGHVALTFDDGPDPASTPQFLDALDRLGWKATFFLLGTMVRRCPSLAAELVSAGHEVAVHGDEHRYQTFRTPRAVFEDLAWATDLVAEASGSTPIHTRPPYGVLTAAGLLAARRRGLRPVLWTTWGRDWRPDATAASVTEDVWRGLGPGGTILLHDSDCTSAVDSWRSALGALPLLAERLDDAGLAVGPLLEHF